MKVSQHHSIECYGATRIQAGHSSNEDSFLIGREPLPYAAIFDGAGNAEQVARSVARFFGILITNQSAKARDVIAWANWVRLMDSQLLGGSQSTFLGMAVPDVEKGLVVGAYAGNSRAYIVGEDGIRLVTAESSPGRLGSGRVQPKTFSLNLHLYDTLLLMSDGAWAPLGSNYHVRRTVSSALARHFSEVPQAILDAATTPEGPFDDMTVVALRNRRPRSQTRS